MDIRYSKKIDKEFFNEINNMGKKLSPIFGFTFPKVKFNKDIVPMAEAMASVGKKFINKNKLKKVIKEIYVQDVPKIIIYINTTPFSTWDEQGKYVNISYNRNTPEKFFSTVCHELNHMMYDKTFGTKKYEYTKIKETITVLNNLFGVKDLGWPKFATARKAVLDFYKKNRNLRETVEYAKKILKN